MPLKLYRRGKIWHYRGTVDGRLLRGSAQTADRKIASQIAAEVEVKNWKRRLDGPASGELRFPAAVAVYLKAGKHDKYLDKIEDYWRNTKVRDMTTGAIRQSAIDLYPEAGGATRNRQAITPTLAVINHCAELGLCAPVRMKRFKFETKIKKPVTVEWLETFCAHARPLNVALVAVMFATACRFNEAHRLEWRDIDFKQRTILIRDSKTQTERVAHMPQRLIVALANLPRDDRPFPWSETRLRVWWNEDVAKTAKAVKGFERLTFHCCRHGFATKMLRDGVDPKTAAKLGGWKDIALFLNTYAHAMNDARITEGIFGTQEAQSDDAPQQKQEVMIK
jgi:integrase